MMMVDVAVIRIHVMCVCCVAVRHPYVSVTPTAQFQISNKTWTKTSRWKQNQLLSGIRMTLSINCTWN